VKQLQLQRTEEVLDGLPPIQYMANVIPLLKHEKSLYDMVHNGVQNFLCWEAVTQPDKDAQYVLGQFILPEMVKNILTAPSSFMYRKHYDSRGQKKADKDWKRFFDFNSRDPPPSNVARGWGLVTLSWEQEIYRLNLLSGRTVQNQKYERSFPAWDALVGLPNSASKFRALGRALFECKARRERALIYASDPYLLRHVLAYLRTTNVECLHLLEPGTYNAKGGERKNTKEDTVSAFQNPKNNVTALLIPLRKMSDGLNLTAANHVIFLDVHLEPHLYKQAIGRIRRIGQQRPQHVMFLINDLPLERTTLAFLYMQLGLVHRHPPPDSIRQECLEHRRAWEAKHWQEHLHQVVRLRSDESGEIAARVAGLVSTPIDITPPPPA
jgi:hypothetical protein